MADGQTPDTIITGTVVATDRGDRHTTTTRAHAALIALARAGDIPPQDLMTLAEHWTNGLAPHTGRAYREAIRAWLAWCATVRGIDSLRAVWIDAEAYAAHLQGDPSPRTGRPLSDSSRKARLSALASWYKRLAKLELIDGPNPFDPAAVARPYVDRHHSTTVGLSKQEAVALRAAARTDTGTQAARTAALVDVLLTCGLRVSEATGADVADLATDTGHRVLIVRGKGGKTRTVPIPPATGHTLDEYLGGRDTGPLFATASGGRMDQAAVWRLLRRLARAAGIDAADRLSPHSLRHTSITLALDAGATLRDVQDMAGHASPETTRRYDRDRERLDRSPVYRLAAILADS